MNFAYTNAELGLDGRMLMAVAVYGLIGSLVFAVSVKLVTQILKVDIKKELAKDHISSTALAYSALLIALGIIISAAY